MRLFLALEPEIAIVERLVELQEDLDEQLTSTFEDAQVRWTRPENIHLTLKFLGEVEPVVLTRLREKLQEMHERLIRFELDFQHIGCFPSPECPRFLWAGIKDEHAKVLSMLNKMFERELEDELGFAQDPRPYRPHVTLGRVRSSSPLDLGDLLESRERVSFGVSQIKDTVLFSSELRPDGPRYEVVDRFSLGVH